jgi:hypothetical protein
MKITESQEFKSNSKQLTFRYLPESEVIEVIQRDMKKAGLNEYVDFIGRIGDCIQTTRVGRLLVDVRELKNYSIDLRAAGVGNVKPLLLDKVPFVIMAFIKGNSLFENMGVELTVKLAKQLSKK